MTNSRVKYGLKLEEKKGVIIAVSIGDWRISVGDNVVSNGRFGAAEGTRGEVIALHEPQTPGITSNVIEVKWEKGKLFSAMMKFKDLVPPSTDGGETATV